jgi:hypothetical protein
MYNGENTVESGGNTIESGLSVSVESSPRTPITVSGGGGGWWIGGGGAPLKKVIQNWRRAIMPPRTDDDSVDVESISPRELFAEQQQQQMNERNTAVRRRLDFSSEELSPIIAAASSSSSSAASASIGDCVICYDSLPLRSNHVFTVCGHLYCVKCFLTWWDTSINCPMCRANLLDTTVAADAAA